MISDDDFNISVSVTLTVFMLLLLGLPIAMIAVGKLLFTATDEQATKFVFVLYFNIFTPLAYCCCLENNGAVGLPSKAFKMHNLIETSREWVGEVENPLIFYFRSHLVFFTHRLIYSSHVLYVFPFRFISFGLILVSALILFIAYLLIAFLLLVVAGSSYDHECPREPRIPIYLLVGGAFGAIEIVIILWQQKKSRDFTCSGDDITEDDDDFDDGMMSRSCRFTGYMLTAFLAVWFVLGNVWVLAIWKPNFQQPLHDPQNWCNEIVFFFAFYQLVAVHGLVALVLLILTTTLIVFTLKRRFRQ